MIQELKKIIDINNLFRDPIIKIFRVNNPMENDFYTYVFETQKGVIQIVFEIDGFSDWGADCQLATHLSLWSTNNVFYDFYNKLRADATIIRIKKDIQFDYPAQV